MTITWKYITITAVAAVSLSFTAAPSVNSVPANTTWEAVSADLQGPQGPAKKKVGDDSTLMFGIDDLAQGNWPGLGSVDGLGSLGDSPINPSSSGGGGGIDGPGGGPGNGGGMASPKIPNSPWTPGGRLLPPAPTAPLSPFMP